MRRRSFLRRAGLGVAGGIALASSRAGEAPANAAPANAAPAEASAAADPAGARPLIIVSKTKPATTQTAMRLLSGGADALEAVIAGVNLVEEDPEDITVGYGGLPNERGVVELDASVMHGPTARGGAVASLRNIKYPSRVARMVMEQTDHVLLVGEGALEFARAHGFPEENLLTEKARRIWLHWKQTLTDKDDWIPPPEAEWHEDVKSYLRTSGTIHCSAIDLNGNISAVTSTSGLAFKIPGRVGDSPLIGCGLYVDNEWGSCGSTGRGEAVILANGSQSVVEGLRHGLTPEQAALRTLEWIANHTKNPLLLDKQGRPDFNVVFYVLDRKRRHAAAALWSGPQYTVQDGPEPRTLDAAYLWRKPST